MTTPELQDKVPDPLTAPKSGRPLIRALGILKKCAALTNGELGQLPKEKADLIGRTRKIEVRGPRDSALVHEWSPAGHAHIPYTFWDDLLNSDLRTLLALARQVLNTVV
jgi:hypothetical protein